MVFNLRTLLILSVFVVWTAARSLSAQDRGGAGAGRVGIAAREGVVRQYAASYLAEMNASEAIGPIEEWLHYLEEKSPYDDEMRATMIKSAKHRLAKLRALEEVPTP